MGDRDFVSVLYDDSASPSPDVSLSHSGDKGLERTNNKFKALYLTLEYFLGCKSLLPIFSIRNTEKFGLRKGMGTKNRVKQSL